MYFILFCDFLSKELGEWNGMVLHDIGKRGVEGGKNGRVGSDDSGLVTITTCEVLGSDDGDRVSGLFRTYQNHLRMVVCQIGVLYDAGEKRPQSERFLRGFEVQDKVDGFHLSGLLDEIEPTQELLGNREGSLPNGSLPNLLENPFHDIGHLQGVRQITLQRTLCKGLEVIIYGRVPFHFDFLALGFAAFAFVGVFFGLAAGVSCSEVGAPSAGASSSFTAGSGSPTL